MKKVILIYGTIAGVIVSIVLLGAHPFYENGTLNFDNGMIIGYASMVISLSMVFFGIKSYRDQHCGGVISFGKGFQVGILISLIAAVMYAGSWEYYYHHHGMEFMKAYAEHRTSKMKANGATEAELRQVDEEMKSFGEMYSNPVIRFAMTLTEIIPVGLLITLLSAALFRKPTFLPKQVSA